MVEHFKPQEDKNENNIKNMAVHCKHCKSSNYAKQGYRQTKNRGKIQKYYCRDCHRCFTADFGFYRMRNSDKIITMSIDMYLSNLSSRKMRNQLKRHMETKISHVSVLDWVRKYVLKVQNFVDKLPLSLSGKIYADETEVDRQKNKDIFWCSVDWDTRFIGATMYSPYHQSVDEALEFIKKINKNGLPKFVQTDAAMFYPKAMKKAYYDVHIKAENVDRMKVEHRVVNTLKTRKHNVRIETVFSKIKDRVYDFRGFKALWSAPILMAGIVLQHNFIEAHTTTGKIPCELAGLNLEAGVNRWLGLIRNASSL